MKRKMFMFFIVAVVLLAIPPIIYIWHFRYSDLSSSPQDWGVLGDYIGGILNPIIAFMTLCVTSYIAYEIHNMESSREKESRALQCQPFCEFSASDYVNSIRVAMKNAGLGPMIIINTRILPVSELHDSNAAGTVDLVKLMPKQPDGIYWSNFTINGPPRVIHQNCEVELLRLDGDSNNPNFLEFRDAVKSQLANIYIEIKYTDIFGNIKEPEGVVLSIFGH